MSNVTVWITEQGQQPITHRGSIRFVCNAAEQSIRDAHRDRRDIKVVFPSDTLAAHRHEVGCYLAEVVTELRTTPRAEPELGWKRRVQ